MKKILALFALVYSTALPAQEAPCTFSMECQIIAPSGMRMRGAPNLKAKVVTYVPYDSSLTACTETFGAMTYEKIEGFWRKVRYKQFEGYMFDGFMKITGMHEHAQVREDTLVSPVSEAPSSAPSPTEKTKEASTYASKYSLMTEAYNYCGDVSQLDPGMLWYGVYPKNEKSGSDNYRIMEVDVDVVLSKQKVGDGLEFDIITPQEERSIFLIGMNRPLDLRKLAIEDKSEQLRFAGRKVFPGQQFLLQEGKEPITLSATGSVENTGPCPELKNYTLLLKGTKYFLKVKQDITQLLVSKGQCGMPELYWYGDLTGDDIPEIIFVSVYDEKNHFTLFVSNPTRDDILLEKSAEWIIDKCY